MWPVPIPPGLVARLKSHCVVYVDDFVVPSSAALSVPEFALAVYRLPAVDDETGLWYVQLEPSS
jgi:hypothetical protein